MRVGERTDMRQIILHFNGHQFNNKKKYDKQNSC